MKITANWRLTSGSKRRSFDKIQFKDVKDIHIADDTIIILADGLPRQFEGKTYEDDRQKLIIKGVTNEDLVDLYLQIQKVLFSKLSAPQELGQDDKLSDEHKVDAVK